MKSKFLFLLISLFSTALSFGQAQKINQLDSKGNKDGKWTVYINDKGKVVKDSSLAVYYLYTYYDHGTNIYPMTDLFTKIEPSPDSKQDGKIKLVDGEYKGLDKNGQIKFIWDFKNGEFVSYKDFYSTGKLHENFDYTKKHFEGKEEPHTYCIYIYDKNGEVKYYYMRKAKDGWMAYGSTSDSTAIDNNKVIGDSTFQTVKFYANGKLIRQVGQIFVQTTKEQETTNVISHGNYTMWYTNGQKQMDGQYNYGKKIGAWKHWNKDGKEIIEKDSK